MSILWTILSIILTVLGWILSIVLWFLSFLFMPLLILAVMAGFALRYAWRTPALKPYVEAVFQKLGDWGFKKSKEMLLLFTVEPFRVISRFIWFSLTYSLVNLLWKPKWTPWTRARQRPKRRK
jgi:hypothetical protein